MADPNAHIHHHLNQQQRVAQQQLVSGPGVPHLIIDPQTQVALAAAPTPMHSQHQFQPQHYTVLDNFWQQQIQEIRHGVHDFKVHQLPLARIKKVMKTDEEVKMISAEAPILFAKGCDIFITELTMRAWHHAEECKRRTLQRSDIANAIKKVDMFDFLIDIVPREEKVSVKNDKMDYQEHQSQYAYGLGMPQSGHQFNPSPSMPVDHKIIVDPMAALHEQQQHLQHMQYMQRLEPQHQQVLHDHSEHQQHQHPPTLLPPLTVAGQQVPSYRAQNRPPYASVPTDVSAGPSVRQVTTEQSYHPPYYHHQPSIQHFQETHHRQQQQAPSQHQLHRQSDHNPVQVKYEFESTAARPVDWFSQPSTQLTNNGHTHGQSGYSQGSSHVSSSHGYGQPLSQSSHDYNHESTSMHLARHDESYVRGGGVQRN